MTENPTISSIQSIGSHIESRLMFAVQAKTCMKETHKFLGKPIKRSHVEKQQMIFRIRADATNH